MAAHAIEERVVEFFVDLVALELRTLRQFDSAINLRNRVIALRLARADPVDEHRGAGRKGADRAIKRVRLGQAAEQVEPDLSRRLAIAGQSASRHQSLDLASKPEGPAIIRIIERLDAVRDPAPKTRRVVHYPKERMRTCRAKLAPCPRPCQRRGAAKPRYPIGF